VQLAAPRAVLLAALDMSFTTVLVSQVPAQPIIKIVQAVA